MAARLNKRQDPSTRAKIQSSQLVNALCNHVLGKNKMNSTQVTAALGLLKKTLPDLSAIEQTNISQDEKSALSDNELEAMLNVTKLDPKTKPKRTRVKAS